MLFKLFLREFKRHTIINTTLLIFMLLSAMLLSSVTYISLVLAKGTNELVSTAKTPHFIQIHAGEIDKDQLESFSEDVDFIRSYQLQELITINPSTIYIDSTTRSELNGVMDISFVAQNESFDYLLNLDNKIAEVEDGKIGVPVYYQVKYELELGDTVTLEVNDQTYHYEISSFIRDGMMNSSLISSKRFLISDHDYEVLSTQIIEREYMMEYLFNSQSEITTFKNMYRDAGLPDAGLSIDIRLFRVMNVLTDGIVVLILLVVAFALTGIGLLCLRYTLLSNIEEDIKEIGVLKAIGIKNKHIQRLYLSKFVVLASIAVITGFALSYPLNAIFVHNIRQYMGNVELNGVLKMVPILGALGVFFLILYTVKNILKRTNKVSVVQTLTSHNQLEKSPKKQRSFSIKRHRNIPLIGALAINTVRRNKKTYSLLIFIFTIATIMMILPRNVFNTFNDPSFIQYMGIGSSDLRYDLRTDDELNDLITYLDQDDDIASFAVFSSYNMRAYNNDNEIENIFVELGDFQTFPLAYVDGHAPTDEYDIALSALSMQSLDTEVGETIRVIQNGVTVEYHVVGMYQDITNGGKTAKAISSAFESDLLWSVISVDLHKEADMNVVRSEYLEQFTTVKITRIQDYLTQTLGDTIDQLHQVSIFAIIIAIIITVLISALFLNMILIKERHQIATEKSIGFTNHQIMLEYITRIIVTVIIGVLFGLAFVLILGDDMISIVSRAFGASKMVLQQETLFAIGIVPLMIILSSTVTTFIVMRTRKQDRIRTYLSI